MFHRLKMTNIFLLDDAKVTLNNAEEEIDKK